jgi:hypothetical protein
MALIREKAIQVGLGEVDSKLVENVKLIRMTSVADVDAS